MWWCHSMTNPTPASGMNTASRDDARQRARLREVGVHESDQSHQRDTKRDRKLRNVDEVLSLLRATHLRQRARRTTGPIGNNHGARLARTTFGALGLGAPKSASTQGRADDRRPPARRDRTRSTCRSWRFSRKQWNRRMAGLVVRAQPIAPACEARLDRRCRATLEHRDLVDLPALDLVQHDRLALHCRQCRRALRAHAAPPRPHPATTRLTRYRRSQPVRPRRTCAPERQEPAPERASQAIAMDRDHDPVQPRLECRVVAQRLELRERSDQRLLKQIIAVAARARHVAREPAAHPRTPARAAREIARSPSPPPRQPIPAIWSHAICEIVQPALIAEVRAHHELLLVPRDRPRRASARAAHRPLPCRAASRAPDRSMAPRRMRPWSARATARSACRCRTG